jgi:hypothetical protein
MVEKFVIGVALVTLIILPVVADPTPSVESPAETCNCAGVWVAPSQEQKAAVQQSDKTQALQAVSQ